MSGGWGDIWVPQSAGNIAEVIPIGPGQIPGDTRLPDPTRIVFGEALAVPINMTATLVTLVTPATAVPAIQLLSINFGGENVAKYSLLFNGVVVDKSIVWYNGPSLCSIWDYRKGPGAGLEVPPSTVVSVTVLNDNKVRPSIADFFARIHYMEIN